MDPLVPSNEYLAAYASGRGLYKQLNFLSMHHASTSQNLEQVYEVDTDVLRTTAEPIIRHTLASVGISISGLRYVEVYSKNKKGRDTDPAYMNHFDTKKRGAAPQGLFSFLNLKGRTSLSKGAEDMKPPKKRRKIGHPVVLNSFILADGGEDFLTLAKMDINVKFGDTLNDESCLLLSAPRYSTLEDNREQVPVQLTKFDKIGLDEHKICLRTADGETIYDDSLRGDVPSSTLDTLQNAITLLRPGRNIMAKSTFTLSSGPPLLHESNPACFLISVRILIPNARSLLDNPGLPRAGNFLSLFNGKESHNIGGPWSPRDFYDHVHVPDKSSTVDVPPVEELHCELYPFQKRAVRWLLERERSSAAGAEDDSGGLAHGFVQIMDADGRKCFMSRFLGLATTRKEMIHPFGQDLCGGILAEEMGLGKTVEAIALICLHRKDVSHPQDGNISDPMPRSPATLIITPPAILQQWSDEFRTLAPSLKVMHYDGLRFECQKKNYTELLQKFLVHDVVLTTYQVLAKEIYYVEAVQRNLRHEKKYEKPRSPLTRVNWWRVILDEAQMVESGVSNAAKVASLIPRQLAWCVSGTPARAAKDLFGLLVFLRYQPYCHLPKLWDRLVAHHRDILQAIFSEIALRHTKAQIRDDIQLPTQKRIVITVPFTPVEEQHYSSMFQQMAEDCGLDLQGGPLHEDWDPEDPLTIEKMRTWLARLRQTCLHPEVGSRNRKALGNGRGPLRTVAEVLEVMIDQNETATRTEERSLLLSQLRRGQIHEHAGESQEALSIWLATLDEARAIVRGCRRQLEVALQDHPVGDTASMPDDADLEAAAVTRTGAYRQKLRAALEIEHMCSFFVANAYYQIKSKEMEAVTDGGKVQKEETLAPQLRSEHAQELDGKEESFYDMAKLLRRELLLESRKKADMLITKVKAKAQQQSFVYIPPVAPPKDQGGIQARPFFERMERLLVTLQSQATQLLAWRAKAISLLTLPLVDEQDTDLHGDEYEASTKQQDEVYVYVDALRAVVSDRHDILTGQENRLIGHEMRTAFAGAKEGRGHSPELLMMLLNKRAEFKVGKDVGSVRGLITELRELKTNLRGFVKRSNARAAAESIIVDNLLQYLHGISTEQTKVMAGLNKEIELFKDTMNLRLEYYRQLQAISDQVAPFEEDMDEGVRNAVLVSKQQEEHKMKARLATLKSKGRYLIHLRDEATDMQSQRMCIICTTPFEIGILTTCGHAYCAECLRLWWGQHRNCPTCKKHLSRNDFHQITYKPQEITMEEEGSASEDKLISATGDEETSAVYSGVKESILHQIKSIDLDGSFGTKIDTVARHMLWLREHDPGAKSIVFSQYRDFLDVLARAFSQFKIGFTGIDRKDGIQKFKNDPGVECFFLPAKAHSSGLNLVNATHVFLCEPLINTPIELQAIARVHRIGQHQTTTVWMYLVEGTVEKSIYDISVQRRLVHAGQLKPSGSSGKGGDEPLENRIEAADTQELEQTPLAHLFDKGSSGGELVRKEDLWRCLFSSKPGAPSRGPQQEISRHLGAEAAEARINQSNGMIFGSEAASAPPSSFPLILHTSEKGYPISPGRITASLVHASPLRLDLLATKGRSGGEFGEMESMAGDAKAEHVCKICPGEECGDADEWVIHAAGPTLSSSLMADEKANVQPNVHPSHRTDGIAQKVDQRAEALHNKAEQHGRNKHKDDSSQPAGGLDETPIPTAPPGYTVKFTFHRATSLPFADFNTLSSDPYVLAQLYTKLSTRHKQDPYMRWRTPTIRRSVDPVWNCDWIVANVPASGFALKARIYDEDPADHDDRLGNVLVHVDKISDNWEGIKEQSFKIKKRMGSKRAYLIRGCAAMFNRNIKMSGNLIVSVEVLGRTDTDNGGRLWTVGPCKWSQHFSPTIGRLAGTKTPAKANQMQLAGPVPASLYHRYVEFKPFIAGMFTATSLRGRILNRALHHQHARIYNHDRYTVYGSFPSPSRDMTLQFLDLVHYDKGGRIYTYVVALDGLWRFTETGKEFGIDLLSKHTMHSDVSIYVAFSGEFFIRRLKSPHGSGSPEDQPTHPPAEVRGGPPQGEPPKDPAYYTLVIDNDSGTYRPSAKLLPQLKEYMQRNLPGLKIVTLDCNGDKDKMNKWKAEQRECKQAEGDQRIIVQDDGSSISSSEASDLDSQERLASGQTKMSKKEKLKEKVKMRKKVEAGSDEPPTTSTDGETVGEKADGGPMEEKLNEPVKKAEDNHEDVRGMEEKGTREDMVRSA
ncbi:MAG: hypothetical protein Q9163_004599 [Psora crenata]